MHLNLLWYTSIDALFSNNDTQESFIIGSFYSYLWWLLSSMESSLRRPGFVWGSSAQLQKGLHDQLLTQECSGRSVRCWPFCSETLNENWLSFIFNSPLWKVNNSWNLFTHVIKQLQLNIYTIFYKFLYLHFLSDCYFVCYLNPQIWQLRLRG